MQFILCVEHMICSFFAIIWGLASSWTSLSEIRAEGYKTLGYNSNMVKVALAGMSTAWLWPHYRGR